MPGYDSSKTRSPDDELSHGIKWDEVPDCPCGGWDCTGAPEGPMYGCPYAEPTCDHGKLQDGQTCEACGCMGNGEG